MIGNKAVDAVKSAEGAGISGRNREKQSTLSKKKVKEEPEEEPNDSNEDNGSGDDYDYEQEQVDELEELDDWGSAWKLCKELGLKWGGRGMGGRATGRTTVQTKDVVVEGCTMAYLGNNLLERTTLRLLEGKKYGLIGRNGVGKSTLLRRIYSGTLPGFPPHLRVAQVHQELPFLSEEDSEVTPVKYVVDWNPERRKLLRKIHAVENGLAEIDENGDEREVAYSVEKEAELLESLYDYLEDEGVATARAVRVLKELGFSEAKRTSPLKELSGGWKMRTAIACALSQEPDILLLDEPTNHLDLEGVEWLKSYINSSAAETLTVLVISHDSSFLDDICTEIIRFHQRALNYYVGNYSAYEQIRNTKELNNSRLQDTVDKQRKHIEDQIKRMQVVASKDSSGKASGAVASRKKKLARHGVEKNVKGHRFRVQQDSYHGMSSIRAGSRNEVALGGKTGASRNLIELAEREWKMAIPDPIPLGTHPPIIQLRSATMGFVAPSEQSVGTKPVAPKTPSQPVNNSKGKVLAISAKRTQPKNEESSGIPISGVVENAILDVDQTSKIAIVGRNGCGKSTLLKMIYSFGEESNKMEGTVSQHAMTFPTLLAGDITKHSALKIAFYQQHQQESLPYDKSSLQYLTEYTEGSNHNEQTLRAHLGAFGLSGDLALQTIGLLSGGQKARVVLAALTISKPHLLLLDEPTNNLDLDAVKAMKEALNKYNGAFIVTSHDMAFIEGTAEVVYYIVKGKLTRLEGGVDDYKAYVRKLVEKQKSTRN